METVDNTAGSTHRTFRNPLDSPILFIAKRFGGSKWKELERFLKFAVVGAIGAVVDFTVLILLQSTILAPTSDLRVSLATGIAFITAVLSNFFWTRRWVYPDSRSRSVRRQLSQFFLISTIGFFARIIWVTATYYDLGHFFMPYVLPVIQEFRPNFVPSPIGEERLGSVIAQMVAVAVVMMWNFLANRFWTYNDVE